MPVTQQRRWALVDLLSPVRMGPYEQQVAGTEIPALALYDWNTRISGAFYESLHYFEVGFRNAADAALTAWADSNGATSSWFNSRVVRLTDRSRMKVRQATHRVHASGVTVSHGKVVAELTFGFWWSLLADEYNRRLWEPCLKYAFEGPVRRRRMHAELDELRRLRNRIAHHEPIHTRDLAADFTRLLDSAGRVAADLATHIDLTSRVPAVLAQRPDLKRGTMWTLWSL